ncbi:hypothetical protein D3C85_1722540 [compost metagenome]
MNTGPNHQQVNSTAMQMILEHSWIWHRFQKDNFRQFGHYALQFSEAVLLNHVK